MRIESKGLVVAILQARMGSTRLPGKTLKKILGKELLSYQLERLKRSKFIDKIVVATTTESIDDEIIELCKNEKISTYRGSSDNVLDRYYEAAKQYHADTIVRVTGDCPLIDPEIVDEVIETYLMHKPAFDYVSNSLERTYPRGLDTEVFSFKGLKICRENAKEPSEKEHVTPYFYLNKDKFYLGNVRSSVDLSAHRWTVDTRQDFELISLILTALYPQNPNFSMSDVLKLFEKHPEWMKINAHIMQKQIRPLA